MDWAEIKTAFDWDGSWRDLYVFDTDARDWRRLLEYVKERGYSLRFEQGVVQPLPSDPSGLFVGESESMSLLMIDIGGVALCAHFFAREEIELDLDPREVQSMTKAEALFDFMRGLGQALGKAVRLTPENQSDYVLFVYDPAADELRRERY